MKLKNPMLVVIDIDKSVEFYKKVLGLHVIMDFGVNETLTDGLVLQTAETCIELKNETHIGELCFKGLDENGVSEIGYGISKESQNQGYATEAVKAVLTWAFQNPNVTAVEAETDTENIVSKRVLEKCGFIANGKIGEEGPCFTVTRP